MPQIIEIEDLADPRLDVFANLRSDMEGRDGGHSFVVEGRWCVQRLVHSRHRVESVLADISKADEVATWLPPDVPVYSLPSEQISQLVGYHFHRGMLASGQRPIYRPLEQLDLSANTPALSLAAVGINEQENLGSMIRTAVAMGIRQLLVGPRTVDPFARRTIRVSMAGIFHQELFRLDRPAEQLIELQRSTGVRTIVTTLDPDATPLDEFVRDDRHCIVVVGNEAAGLDREIQNAATDRVTIPMRLGTDSLNVAVAAAIFLYELSRKS